MSTVSDIPIPPLVCIGGGNMGGAILTGLTALDPCPQLAVIDPSPAVAERYQSGPIKHFSDMAAMTEADVMILAVKPQIGAAVAEQVAPFLRPEQLLISILAGTTLDTLQSWFPGHSRIIRAMPNTPMAIGKGMVGLAPLPALEKNDIAVAQQIFAVSAKGLGGR